jgi:DNA-binding beta-propeller fold protein YncE
MRPIISRQTKTLPSRTGLRRLAVVLAAGSVMFWALSTLTAPSEAVDQPRLVSYEPIDEPGEVCLMPDEEDVVANSRAGAAFPLGLWEASLSAQTRVPQEGSSGTRSYILKRDPVRTLRDTTPTFSSVAVDVERGDVFAGAENSFEVLNYDSKANTPPNAPMTEPKGIIGGDKTKIDYVCGLYVDPKTGDLYVLNDDTELTMSVYPRGSKGNIPAPRELTTPKYTFGLAVDDDNQELYMTVQADAAVVVFPKMASGNDAPLRLLQGDKTLLADPHGVAVDSVNNEIFVVNFGGSASRKPANPNSKRKANWPLEENLVIPGSGKFAPPSINVYERTAHGDVAPIRVIQGPKAQLNMPAGIVVDPKRKELYVANDMDHSILVFSTEAQGDVAPIRVIKGAKTGFRNPTGLFLDFKNDELWVANFGNNSLVVHKRTANGDIAPMRTIRSAPTGNIPSMIGNPGGVAYDTKRDQILVPSCVAHPRIAAFARLANGKQAPVRAIEGQSTLLGRSTHAIEYDEVHDEIFVAQKVAAAVLVFNGASAGETPPIRVIQGTKTQFTHIDRVAIDPINNELYVPDGDRMLVFPRDANGNVAPIRILEGPDTHLGGAAAAIDTVNDLLITAGTYRPEGGKREDRILIFKRTAQGNEKPLREIVGPNTILDGGSKNIRVHGQWILVAHDGIQGGGETKFEAKKAGARSYLGIWNINDNGNVAPRWTLGGPQGILSKPRGVAVNPKYKEVIVSDKDLNAVLTYSMPEIFEQPRVSPSAPGGGQGQKSGAAKSRVRDAWDSLASRVGNAFN